MGEILQKKRRVHVKIRRQTLPKMRHIEKNDLKLKRTSVNCGSTSCSQTHMQLGSSKEEQVSKFTSFNFTTTLQIRSSDLHLIDE